MQKLLTAVVVLQVAILYTLWTGNSVVAPAHAQIPDQGAQQQQMIDELKAINGKLDHLATTLDSGRIRVVVANPQEKQQGGK